MSEMFLEGGLVEESLIGQIKNIEGFDLAGFEWNKYSIGEMCLKCAVNLSPILIFITNHLYSAQ